jgi:hypothetical protein
VDAHGQRIAKNEVIFREVNERLRELGESFSLSSELAEFVCECADTACAERIQMPLSAYEHVRSNPTWFVLLAGHEAPRYEQVVERHESYWIVEKLPGGPAETAVRNDPRS